MCRKILIFFLFTCLLLSLVGCGASQTEPYLKNPDNASSETNVPESSVTSQADASGPTVQEESSSTLDTPVPDSSPAEKENPQAESEAPVPSGKPANSQKANSAIPPEETRPLPAEPERPAESTPVPTKPAASEPTEPPPETPPATQPEKSEPEPEPELPAFNIDEWVSFAKGYAENIGLALDSEAIWCWDNPITAGSHCLYLERDIRDRLNRYGRDGDITAVWIWAEPRGDGSYDLYIGYA